MLSRFGRRDCSSSSFHLGEWPILISTSIIIRCVQFGANSHGNLRSFAMVRSVSLCSIQRADEPFHAQTGAFLVYPFIFNGLISTFVLNVISPSSSSALPILLLGYIHEGMGMLMSFAYVLFLLLKRAFIDAISDSSSFTFTARSCMASRVALRPLQPLLLLDQRDLVGSSTTISPGTLFKFSRCTRPSRHNKLKFCKCPSCHSY